LTSLSRMTECSNAVQRWFLENDLLLNGSKTGKCGNKKYGNR